MKQKLSIPNQFLISSLLILLASLTSYFLLSYIGYRGVALIFLLVVSICAMFFDIYPVLATALLSGLILNFFFIPPTHTFHIHTTEDVLLFFMYLCIALINAVLNINVRDFERKKRNEEKKNKTIDLYNTLLNSLSHEIRTPIATIIGAIDTIKDENIKLSPKNKAELHTEIEIAGLRLNRQVENLLSMSRLEAGTLQPRSDWYDINELIFHVIKTNVENLNHHSIDFTPNETLSSVKIDGGFLETLMQNLVHNALQHTPQKTAIKIETKYEKEKLVIVISDNGLGFPANEIDFVFDKFYKLDGTAPGGTGLGLSIVKGFAQAMNGTIQLENIQAGGARFTLKIPAQITSINTMENE